VLRVWLGAFGTASPGAMNWTLDSQPVTPEPLLPLRPAHLHGARCATGVFQFPAPAAGSHRIAVRETGGEAEIVVRTLAPEIPKDDWLRVLLVSCYYRGEDAGHLARIVEGLPPAARPDFSILMGDQVYLDLPTLADFPDDEASLAVRFEKDYTQNWTERRGLASVLAAAPSISAPDDHEYWNNFPHAAPAIENSWSPKGRQHWGAAASALYDAFQTPAPAARGQAVEIPVDPFSFLIFDQRSFRLEDQSRSATAEAIDQLDDWVTRLVRDGKHGALVTGQSLLDLPASGFEGKIADRTPANYGDYGPILRSLVRLADAGRPALLLTGDVHWGRVTAIREAGRALFYEVICSPASLVSFVGVDQLKTLGSAIAGLFGRNRNRWPRHADPAKPSALFAPKILGRKLDNVRDEPAQKGDQIAMLHLRQSAGTIELKVVYHEIHGQPQPPLVKGPWLLRPNP
jgi:hypothetical protein